MSALPHQVALVSEAASISFSDLSVVAAALQKQATRDFGPLWKVNATVSAFETLESIPVDYWPVIIRDNISQPGAAGYHTDEHGQPFALVQADDAWPLTASHETLEMLADPFGNRTVAGSPPPQAPAPLSAFKRVVYLLEVCDPCEDAQFAYGVNGQTLSDFITPSYYSPTTGTQTHCSFSGNVKAPHTVLEGGYVSFGNPVTKDWYQIQVINGEVQAQSLGRLNTNGRSLRETVDLQVRAARSKGFGQTKKAAASPIDSVLESGAARARNLREFIHQL
jgi:hypothetical protein